MGTFLPRGGFPCFCDRVIIISIILFDWKYRGNHTSREKIKSCYWGDLKEAKVGESQGHLQRAAGCWLRPGSGGRAVVGREDGGFKSYAMASESNPKGKGKALYL